MVYVPTRYQLHFTALLKNVEISEPQIFERKK